MKYRILVIDDEQEILTLVENLLVRDGYSVLTADTGTKGLKIAQLCEPDLIVLDLVLTDMDGLEVCKTIKKDPKLKIIPIIILSGKHKTEEKIKGLQLGADDYVVKPFSPKELKVRIEAVLRRLLWKGATEMVIKRDPLFVNLTTHEVKVGEKNIKLTKKEFALLYLLVSKEGRVLDESFLLNSVWDFDTDVYAKTLDVHIYRLRKKLGKRVGSWIKTIRGIGYKFDSGTINK